MLDDLPGPTDSPVPSASPVDGAPPSHVVAIVVTHDATRWLDQTLAGLTAQTRPVDAVVVVDTGSLDASPRLALELVPGATVVPVGRRLGFGAAVAAGVAAVDLPAERTGWLWLLHDDSAPDPDALAHLLAAADPPEVGVVGPKVVDWLDPRRLLEVGLTTDAAGRRITGLEPGEVDQGQHDGTRDVLAVGSPGMLVRADVWAALGGFDRQLALWRDDLDLCWRARAAGYRVVVEPAARVRHAAAATNRNRRLHAVRGRGPAVDRRHALYTVAVNRPGPLPWLLLRLVVAAVVRSLVLVVTRRPAAASRELGAAGWLLRRSGTVVRARRRRRRRRTVSPEALRPLFPPRTARLRAAVDVVGGWATSGSPDDLGPGLLDPDSDDDLPPAQRIPAFLTQPGVLLALGLVAVTAVAVRSIAGGDGVLSGGRLLPPPGGASDLWSTVLDSWHRFGAGTDASAPAYLAVLAIAATVLLGNASAVLDLLLVAAVPLAGVLAYRAARQALASPALRAWAGATYALLPVATGAVATGRLDLLVLLVVLPSLLGAGARLWAAQSWREGLRPGLGLALAAAFSPLGGVVLAGVALVAALVRRPARPPLLALAAAVGVPLVVLLPQWLALAADPGRLLHGPGRLVADPDLVDPRLPGPALAALWPGGAGLPPAWAAVALLVAAAAGLLRRTRRDVAVAGWLVAGTGYAAALLVARLETRPDGGADLVAWPGVPLLVAGAGLLVAALAAADGLRGRLARLDFGWRQVLAGLTAAAALLTPVLLAGLWLARGAEDPVRRAPVTVLPAFAAADLAQTPGARVLTLRADTALGYDLTGGGGARLGAADLPMDPDQRRRLDAVVQDLVVPRGSDAGAALGTYGVRYVVATGPAAAALATALDTQSGLARVPFSGVRLWELPDASARITVLSPELARTAAGARAPQLGVPDRPRPVEGGAVPEGPEGRVVVLAEAFDDGWVARLDGRELAPTRVWGWAQGFRLPPDDGDLTIEHRSSRPALTAALQAAAVVGLLALGRRPERDEDEEAGP